VPSRVKRKRFFSGIRARIGVDEPANLDVVLIARARSARPARTGDLVLAERHLPRLGGTRSVRLKPVRRLVGTSGRFRVLLRVTATDAAHNQRTVTKRIRVRAS
jgi:hypothetical protein